MRHYKHFAVLLVAVLLCLACGITAFADDNADSGNGNTSGATQGYGWYNSPEHLWKVSLYVGKSDTANKNSNLINNFYLVGDTSIYIKNTNWSVWSSTKFGAYNKVQYYNGTQLAYAAPKIISHSGCPKVPIACGGNIDIVKSYFGDTNTVNMILNALAEVRGTSQAGLVSGLNFTIGGVTQRWDSSYILPRVSGGKLQNRVPWVIIYEPVVVAHLKDKSTTLAFTATEFALAQSYGWDNFMRTGNDPQKIQKLTHQHLPTSVQLEYGWFGYPVYQTTDGNATWRDDAIIKGGGWGMRYLDAQNIVEPTDFGTYFDFVPSTRENSTVTVKVIWKNYRNASFSNVPCSFYIEGKLIWSGSYNFGPYEAKTQNIKLTIGWGTYSRSMRAQINYAKRNQEVDPNDNDRYYTIAPSEYIDFSVQNLAIDKSHVYPGDTVKVTFRTDNWNQEKAYSNIPVELLYNGQIIKTEYVNFTAYGVNYHTISLSAGTLGSRDITARINWANRSREVNASNNSVTKNITVEKYYDLSVSDLTLSKTTEYENQEITVRCRTDNWDQYNAYNSVPVELVYDGRVVATQYVDYPAYALRFVEFKLYTGTSLGIKNVQVRINWANRNSEVTADNNIAAQTLIVKEDIDLSISAVTPNASYRAGTTVVTSFNVNNLSTHHITPSRNLFVTFRAYYYDNGAQKEITTMQKSTVVIPSKNSNLVYFKWSLPSSLGGKTIYYNAYVNSPQTIEESNYSNNSVTKMWSVIVNTTSSTANPEFILERPSGWYDSKSVPSTKNGMTSAGWYEWIYQNSSFVRKYYYAYANADSGFIFPHETNPSAARTAAGWKVKSGYGISVSFMPGITMSCPSDAVTGFQRGEVYFPEFNYSAAESKYCTLQLSGGQFVLRYNSSSNNNDRVHFIPVWKSDGKYYVQVTASDLWTPGGMLKYSQYDGSLTIEGSMYDDYYTNRN